ncbi:ferredoxin [Candidatus Zixiibacteriota bacterium]
MKIKVDKDQCAGDGICVEICPQLIRQDDEGLAEAIQEDVPQKDEDDVREAADACPTECIIVEKDN